MNHANINNIGPEEEAGLWDARLRAPDCSDEDRAAHKEWLEENPANKKAFEGIQSIVTDLPRLAAMPEIQSMRAAALGRVNEAAATPPKRVRWLPIGSAVAASLAIIVAASVFFTNTNPEQGGTLIAAADNTPTFATKIGERTDIPLVDGSAATLNTDSKIDVRYREDERAIVLVKGEAHFDVAHNSERPFVVYAGAYKVTAIGTAFDVKMVGEKVGVVVTEGEVAVVRIYPDGTESAKAGASLVAGQQFSGSAEGPAYRMKADLGQATSWRQGNAVFDDMPLQLAAQEMNRYSTTKLTITDPRLANTQISGMFITGNQDSFVEALEQYFDVKATRKSDTEILLEPARPYANRN